MGGFRSPDGSGPRLWWRTFAADVALGFVAVLRGRLNSENGESPSQMTESCICVVGGDSLSRQITCGLAAELGADHRAYSGAEGLLATLPEHPIVVVVAEFRVLGISGLELQATLNQMDRVFEIIFHTAHAETKLTVNAMRAGAQTVLEKPASEQDLWDALKRSLVHGRARWKLHQHRSVFRARLAELSERERHVLRLMLEGCPNKEIARHLEVSLRTVETSRHNIFRKTRTDSVAELVRQVYVNGVEMHEL